MAEIEKVDLGETGQIVLPTLDIEQYVGNKVEIDTVQEFKGEYGYFLTVSTEVLGTHDGREGEIQLRASRNFGLQEDKDGNIGWGKDTNLGRFLEKMKVDHYKNLKGCKVIVQTQTNTKTGKDYLSFN